MNKLENWQKACTVFSTATILLAFAPWYQYVAEGHFSGSMTISGVAPGYGYWTAVFSVLVIISMWWQDRKRLTPAFAWLAFLYCFYALAQTPDMNVNVDFGTYGSQSAKWTTGWGLIASVISSGLSAVISLFAFKSSHNPETDLTDASQDANPSNSSKKGSLNVAESAQ